MRKYIRFWFAVSAWVIHELLHLIFSLVLSPGLHWWKISSFKFSLKKLDGHLTITYCSAHWLVTVIISAAPLLSFVFIFIGIIWALFSGNILLAIAFGIYVYEFEGTLGLSNMDKESILQALYTKW